MKKFLGGVIVFLFFIHTSCLAQLPVLSWAKSIGGNDHSQGWIIMPDAAGNVYTMGVFDSTIDLDPGPGIYSVTSTATELNAQNIFISKVDPSGNFLWGKSIPNTNNEYTTSMVIDSSGNLYAAGCFGGTAVFEPNTGVNNLVSSGNNDFFIFKMDPAGNFTWTKRIGGTETEYAITLALRKTGFYLAGNFSGTVDFDPGPGIHNLSAATATPDAFIAKFDDSGNLDSVVQMSSPLTTIDIPYSMATDSSDNIYIGGYFVGTEDFDPGPTTHNLSSGPNQNVYILKLDSSFNFNWVSLITGPQALSLYSIAVDGLRNVYIEGEMRGTVDFDPGPGVYQLTAIGVADNFVCKLNASGGFEWANQIGNDGYGQSTKLAVDISGNVYVTGAFQGTEDFDPGPGVYNLSAYGGNNDVDIFVCKINPSGGLVWAQQLGGSGSDIGTGVFVDTASNIYLTGRYELTVDFDPGPGIFNLPYASHGYVYVLKLSPPTIAPLTLLDFSGKLINDHNVQLQWQTTMEQNTDKFIIERSLDSRKFSSIGTVADANNSSTTKNYFFTDKDPQQGNNFYRLKMMDKDGLFTYSKIKELNISKSTLQQVYPNPAKDILYIKAFGENEMATLRIIDAAGKIVKEETLKLNGIISLPINIQELSNGKYSVVLQTKNDKNVITFLKQ